MKKNRKLNIEIGELCIGIDIEADECVLPLKNYFRSFLSNDEARYGLRIVSQPGSPEERGITSPIADVHAVERGGAVLFYTNTRPAVLLGMVDPHKRRASFFHRSPSHIDQYLISFIRTIFQTFLFMERGFVLHSCAVIKDKAGYVFSGPSGCGKTTISSMLSDGFTSVSDEYVCLRKIGDDFKVYATPWKGRVQDGYRLKQIFFPSHGPALRLKKMSQPSAVREILSNIVYPLRNSRALLVSLFDTVLDIAATIPCYGMEFALSTELSEEIFHDT